MSTAPSLSVTASARSFVRKINLGCGISGVSGWHNFDNSPAIWMKHIPVISNWKRVSIWPKDVRRADARKALPFPPGSVDCIYSSHMLEHLTEQDAVCVLQNCRRVLRRGGVMRIVVPDLRYLIDRYLGSDDQFAAKHFIDSLHIRSTASDLVHSGAHHKVMYDAKYLEHVFRMSGFAEPRQMAFGESAIPDICSVELVARKHESLYMEALR